MDADEAVSGGRLFPVPQCQQGFGADAFWQTRILGQRGQALGRLSRTEAEIGVHDAQ